MILGFLIEIGLILFNPPFTGNDDGFWLYTTCSKPRCVAKSSV